jgi:hypothetical protein
VRAVEQRPGRRGRHGIEEDGDPSHDTFVHPLVRHTPFVPKYLLLEDWT